MPRLVALLLSWLFLHNHRGRDSVASSALRLPNPFKKSTSSTPNSTPNSAPPPHGAHSPTPLPLPWTESVDRKRDLVYMPMLRHQLAVMQQLGMTEVPLSDTFTYRTSTVKPARIGNTCYQSDRFRKVRLTYFDAGDSVQVFNALWYPSYAYDLPLLGIDLISLGKGRVLTVVDFQPLHPTPDYHAKHIAPLTAIRNKYPDLQGTLSGKIYDDTSFFRCVLFCPVEV